MTRVSARSEARRLWFYRAVLCLYHPSHPFFYERSRIVLPLPTPHQQGGGVLFFFSNDPFSFSSLT